MLPKNSKHYIVPTAEQLELDLQLVEDAVSFYYANLRSALSNLVCHNIQVENLGSFKAKSRDLPKLVIKYKKHLSVIKTDTFNQMAIKKDVESKLEKVVNLQKLIKEDKERKAKFLKNKHAYTSKNMARKKKNS
jgi:hypothetical protein